MDFLTTAGIPWRISVDPLTDLVSGEEVLSTDGAVFRVTTPYAAEQDVSVVQKSLTRKRAAGIIRKHLRSHGRNQKKVDGTTHKDCFLMDITAHESETGVFVVTIQCADEIGQPTWADIKPIGS